MKSAHLVHLKKGRPFGERASSMDDETFDKLDDNLTCLVLDKLFPAP